MLMSWRWEGEGWAGMYISHAFLCLVVHQILSSLHFYLLDLGIPLALFNTTVSCPRLHLQIRIYTIAL